MMPVIIDTRVPRHTGLNRTFYGIETLAAFSYSLDRHRLNRTFYGIETSYRNRYTQGTFCLNRTFYGIET